MLGTGSFVFPDPLLELFDESAIIIVLSDILAKRLLNVHVCPFYTILINAIKISKEY